MKDVMPPINPPKAFHVPSMEKAPLGISGLETSNLTTSPSKEHFHGKSPKSNERRTEFVAVTMKHSLEKRRIERNLMR